MLDPRLLVRTPDEAEALTYVGYLATDCVGHTRSVHGKEKGEQNQRPR
jgi:hypothetical protein